MNRLMLEESRPAVGVEGDATQLMLRRSRRMVRKTVKGAVADEL